jgi:hypothetical protein
MRMLLAHVRGSQASTVAEHAALVLLGHFLQAVGIARVFDSRFPHMYTRGTNVQSTTSYVQKCAPFNTQLPA